MFNNGTRGFLGAIGRLTVVCGTLVECARQQGGTQAATGTLMGRRLAFGRTRHPPSRIGAVCPCSGHRTLAPLIPAGQAKVAELQIAWPGKEWEIRELPRALQASYWSTDLKMWVTVAE